LAVLIESEEAAVLLDDRHQLARVFLPGKEVGVEEGSKAGIGAEPEPGLLFLVGDGLLRALGDARGAALAGERIHAIGVISRDNGVKAADLVAGVAEPALGGIDDRYLSTHEDVLFHFGGRKHQFEVGGVYVGVGQDAAEGVFL
jgi:hypothetical protein